MQKRNLLSRTRSYPFIYTSFYQGLNFCLNVIIFRLIGIESAGDLYFLLSIIFFFGYLVGWKMDSSLLFSRDSILTRKLFASLFSSVAIFFTSIFVFFFISQYFEFFFDIYIVISSGLLLALIELISSYRFKKRQFWLYVFAKISFLSFLAIFLNFFSELSLAILFSFLSAVILNYIGVLNKIQKGLTNFNKIIRHSFLTIKSNFAATNLSLTLILFLTLSNSIVFLNYGEVIMAEWSNIIRILCSPIALIITAISPILTSSLTNSASFISFLRTRNMFNLCFILFAIFLIIIFYGHEIMRLLLDENFSFSNIKIFLVCSIYIMFLLVNNLLPVMHKYQKNYLLFITGLTSSMLLIPHFFYVTSFNFFLWQALFSLSIILFIQHLIIRNLIYK